MQNIKSSKLTLYDSILTVSSVLLLYPVVMSNQLYVQMKENTLFWWRIWHKLIKTFNLRNLTELLAQIQIFYQNKVLVILYVHIAPM